MTEKEKEKNILLDREFHLVIKKKIILNLSHFCKKLQSLIKRKEYKLKTKTFNHLISKFTYSFHNQKENKKFYCLFCKKNKIQTINNNNINDDEKNNYNKCDICKKTLKKIKDDYIDLFHQEKFLLKNKLKNIFITIGDRIDNKLKLLCMKYFLKWNNIIKFNKYSNKFKNEQEKKISEKFESKITEESKLLKKLEKEKVEVSIRNESLLQSIQVYSLKINSFGEKEKNLISRLKTLDNEKKKNLIDLQKNEANIDKKIENIELENKNFENKIEHLKEIKAEKDSMINNYIDEMNYVLDIYEMKTSKFIFYLFIL